MNRFIRTYNNRGEVFVFGGAIVGCCIPAAMTGYHAAKYGDYPETIPMGVGFCLMGSLFGALAGGLAPFTVPAGAVGMAVYCYTRATTTTDE